MYLYPTWADGGADMARSRAATANRVKFRALSSYTPGMNHAAIVAATIGAVAIVPTDIESVDGGSGVRLQRLVAKTVPVTAAHNDASITWVLTDDTLALPLLAGPGAVDEGLLPLAPGGSLTSPLFPLTTQPQPV